MRSINTSNKINFGAKLNINQITQNKERWQNIAQCFKENTDEKYPDTTLDLSDKSQGLQIENNRDFEIYCAIKNNAYEKLMSLSDENIVKKLTKLLDMGIRVKEINTKCNDIADKFELDEDQYDQFYDKIQRGFRAENREILNQDDVFIGCDFYC